MSQFVQFDTSKFAPRLDENIKNVGHFVMHRVSFLVAARTLCVLLTFFVTYLAVPDVQAAYCGRTSSRFCVVPPTVRLVPAAPDLYVRAGGKTSYKVTVQGNVEDPVIVTQKIAHPSGGSPITIFPSRLIFPQVDSARDGLTQVVTIQTHYDGDGNDAFIIIGHTVSYGDVKDIDLRKSASIWIEDVEAFGISVNPSTITITEGKSEGSAYWVNLEEFADGADRDELPPPHDTVRIEPLPESDNLILDPKFVTFTPDEWNKPKKIIVTAKSDNNNSDEEFVVIRHSISVLLSGRPRFTRDAGETVYVTVKEAAPPPVAKDDRLAVQKGKHIRVPASLLLENDDHPGGYQMFISAVGGETSNLRIDPAGRPIDSIYVGHDDSNVPSTGSFTYTVRDSEGGTDTATVTVEITGQNRPPVAQDDSAAVERDGTVGIAVMANDKDPDDDAMSVSVDSPPSHGTTTVLGSGSDAGKIRYVHGGGKETSDSFTYKVNDGTADSNIATVTITIESVPPQPPVPRDDSVTVTEGGTEIIDVKRNDDIEGDDLTVSVVRPPSHGTATAIGSGPDAGKIRYVHGGGKETSDSFTYTVSDENGATATAAVTITVTPPIENEKEQKAVTETVKAVAAATAANIAANIGTRFSAGRSGGTLVVGGQRVSFGPSPADPSVAANYDPFADSARVDRTRYLGLDDLLRSSAFEMTLGAAEDGTQGGGGATRWTLWGRGDLQFFESDPERGSRYDGDLKAGYLGVEAWMGERWLAGVAGSRTMAEADYGLGEGGAEDGRLEMSLTSVHPYVRYALDARSEIWAFLGAGRGEIEIEPMGVGTTGEKSDVKMWMGSVGGRRTLKPAGAFKLALLGDWGFARVDTDDELRVVAFDQLTVDTWRARLGVEGSHTIEMESGGALTPFLEVAGRYDGGDGEDEGGIEISGGLSLADPAAGFGIEARGRWLAWHSAEDYSEHGVSVTASLSPRSDGTGLSLSVSPRWGAGTGGADALWREDALGRLGLGSTDAAALSLDTRAGYGVRAMRGLLTPFGELGLREHGGRRVRVGVRFDRAAPVLHDQFSLELSGERYESGRRAAPDHRVNLTSRLRF